MAGSEAEERIRAKVEAAMRRQYPDARIVHELVLDQGGVRIDLAAITTDQLVVAEIKSERDTLKRLAEQVSVATEAAQQVWVIIADRLWPKFELRTKAWIKVTDGEREGCWRLEPNPEYIPRLKDCRVYREAEAGLEFAEGFPQLAAPRLDPRGMLNMLWAAELQYISQSKLPRQPAIDLCVEAMTGKEIRRAVCAAIRSRKFPRADEASAWVRP